RSNGVWNAAKIRSGSGRNRRPAASSARRKSPMRRIWSATGSSAIAQPGSTMSLRSRRMASTSVVAGGAPIGCSAAGAGGDLGEHVVVRRRGERLGGRGAVDGGGVEHAEGGLESEDPLDGGGDALGRQPTLVHGGEDRLADRGGVAGQQEEVDAGLQRP